MKECVVVDTAIIASAPAKFLVSGMGDALGTYFEARACLAVDAPSLENGGITRSAMALCELCYKTLKEYGGLAVAHSVYNGMTALDECTAMHGSCVAFGTIAQLIIEGAPKAELKEVMDFCYSVGLPVTLKEMGITDPSRIMIAAEKACVPGETIHNMPGDVTPEQLYHAMLAADLLGQEYFK